MHRALPLTALVVAAGSGRRLAGDLPKGFRPLGGSPLFLHSLAVFDRTSCVADHVLVVPSGREDQARRAAAGVIHKRLVIVAGGPRRQDSVLRGLEAAMAMGTTGPARPTDEGGMGRMIAVHDAARPFVTEDLIERCAASARSAGAAIPLVPVSDTVREIGAGGRSRILERSVLKLAQTPQVARLDWLLESYGAADRDGAEVTDEGAALDRSGFSWSGVAGSPANSKITTPEDLEAAEGIVGALRDRSGARTRVGTGEDRHVRAPERPFVLAGVVLDEKNGPLGHSDADPLCHALIDALLGASSGGSIGEHFPDTDPRWSGASGLDLLGRVVETLSSQGWRIVNVDAVVVADTPRLGPHVQEIRRRLAATMRLGEDRVSVKGKRAEGLGFEGRGAGVSCRAVALIEALGP